MCLPPFQSQPAALVAWRPAARPRRRLLDVGGHSGGQQLALWCKRSPNETCKVCRSSADCRRRRSKHRDHLQARSHHTKHLRATPRWKDAGSLRCCRRVDVAVGGREGGERRRCCFPGQRRVSSERCAESWSCTKERAGTGIFCFPAMIVLAKSYVISWCIHN